MYNISIIIDKSDITPIYIHKDDLLNHNFVTARFIEGKDIVGLYISHQLGNFEIDKIIQEIGYSVKDPAYIPKVNDRDIKAMETTHIFFWDTTGFIKRVTIENGIIHYHRDNEIISEYPITTGAKIECLQSLRQLTNHDIDCHISIKVNDNDESKESQ